MAKVVFEFPTKDAADNWLAAYYNSGEQEILEGLTAIGEDWVEPEVREEQ